MNLVHTLPPFTEAHGVQDAHQHQYVYPMNTLYRIHALGNLNRTKYTKFAILTTRYQANIRISLPSAVDRHQPRIPLIYKVRKSGKQEWNYMLYDTKTQQLPRALSTAHVLTLIRAN